MNKREFILTKRQEIRELAARYGARRVRLFGSVSRGDDHEGSDADFVVRFDPGRSLLDHGGLLMELTDLLGFKVDVLSEGGLSQAFANRVDRESIEL